MPTLAVLTFPVDEVLLADTVQLLPECRFRVEESAFSAVDRSINVWIAAETTETDAVDEALEADASVSDHELVRTGDGEWLYDLDVAEGILLPREIVLQHGGTIRAAFGGDDRWRLRTRFRTRQDLSAAGDAFDRYGIDVTYESIEDLDGPTDSRDGDLSQKQKEVLQAAVEMGYYEVPRETTLEELADHVGVSHQALSERLRRAQEVLVSNRLSKEVTRQTPEGADVIDAKPH